MWILLSKNKKTRQTDLYKEEAYDKDKELFTINIGKKFWLAAYSKRHLLPYKNKIKKTHRLPFYDNSNH